MHIEEMTDAKVAELLAEAEADAEEELEDLIGTAIQDSFDEDWTSSYGARAVTRALAAAGYVITKA